MQLLVSAPTSLSPGDNGVMQLSIMSTVASELKCDINTTIGRSLKFVDISSRSRANTKSRNWRDVEVESAGYHSQIIVLFVDGNSTSNDHEVTSSIKCKDIAGKSYSDKMVTNLEVVDAEEIKAEEEARANLPIRDLTVKGTIEFSRKLSIKEVEETRKALGKFFEAALPESILLKQNEEDPGVLLSEGEEEAEADVEGPEDDAETQVYDFSTTLRLPTDETQEELIMRLQNEGALAAELNKIELGDIFHFLDIVEVSLTEVQEEEEDD